MTPEHEITEQLAELGRTWPTDTTFVEGVMRRIAALPPQVPDKVTGWKRWRRLLVGMAVMLLLGLGAWQFFLPESRHSQLYAQVLKAARKVETIHEVAQIIEDGKPMATANEMWFARGRGFAVRNGEFTRIDDGKFFWQYVEGNKFAARSRSQGTDALLDQALDIKGELNQLCRRLPEGDRTIDGRRCQCYQLAIPPERRAVGYDDQGKTLIFLSEDFLVRRVETDRIVAEKKIRLVRTWEYDVPVPPDVFRPAFPAEVAIVDSDEVFDRLTDVRSAVSVEERNGLTFAVHRAERFENGGILLMTSVRGTAETLKKYPLERRMIQTGLYFTEPTAQNWQASPQGHGFFRITLASTNHQGINVQWWLIVPRGRAPDWFEVAPGECKLEFGITPNGKYASEHKDDRGVIHHITWQQTIPVPRPEKMPTLARIAENAYADVSLLRSVPFTELDLGVEDSANGIPIGKRGNLDDTTMAQFVTSVSDHVRYWMRNDIDFQIQQGALFDYDPNTKVQVETPAVFLDYYTHVNDDDLKRIANRPIVHVVSLRGTKITDQGLAHFKPFNELRDLNLAETGVTDAGLASLRELKTLKNLNVTATRVTAAGIRELQTAIPELKIVTGQ